MFEKYVGIILIGILYYSFLEYKKNILVKKIIIIHIFILFSERTPPQKKQKYRLLILIIYTTFTSDLTSFSFRREPQGGKNRLSAKKMNFFPSAFYSH